MQRLIIGFCFFLSAGSCWCQDIFELKFKLAALPAGKALLLRNKDGKGFVRLFWTDKKKSPIVVDMELIPGVEREFLYPATGQRYLFCKAEVVKNIAGKFKNDFNYINFWFKKDSLIPAHYSPCTDSIPIQYDDLMDDKTLTRAVFAGQVTADTTQPAFRGIAPNIISFKRLTINALNRNYLALYFADFELTSQSKFTIPQLMAVRVRNQPVLYCISVIDSKDSSIGATCIRDARRVNEFFRDIASFIHLPYRPVVIENSNFGKQAITNAIKKIHPGKNDIVVFYYSGHGFSYRNDDSHPFPQLALWRGDASSKAMLRSSTMNIEAIYSMIKAKGARLNLVMSDCCNSFVEMKRYEDTKVISAMQYFPRWNKIATSKLFLDTRSSFLIAATKKSQLAGSNAGDGGFFTFAFCQTFISQLEDRNDNFPDWMNLVKRTGAKASTISLGYVCAGKPCEQTMIYKITK